MRNLRDARIEKGLTQYILEELSGITQTQISLIERGKHKPNRFTRVKLEQVLGPIDWSETSGIQVRGNYQRAERLANQLIGVIKGLDDKEFRTIKQLLFKYLKRR